MVLDRCGMELLPRRWLHLLDTTPCVNSLYLPSFVIELISVVWNVQLPQKSKTFTVHTALESNITELLSGSPTRRPRFAKLSPTSLHRLRGLRRFRHGIEFRPSRQDLPPSERNPHWIYRRCQSCYRCGWLVGIIWERIGHKVDREWITGDYV